MSEIKKYEYDAILCEDKDSGGAYVVFPWDLKEESGKGRLKVHAEFDGIGYDGSIVNMGVKNPDGSICYVIGVLKSIRKELNKSAGDKIHVIISANVENETKWKCPKCGREFNRKNQDHYCVKPQNIDEYIAVQDERYQPRLKEVREVFKNALPQAQERISCSIPTYWKGRNIIHFACAKKHLSIYPGDEATEEFAGELSAFDVSKGTIRIPYDQPLPVELIEKIARWCYEKYAE